MTGCSNASGGSRDAGYLTDAGRVDKGHVSLTAQRFFKLGGKGGVLQPSSYLHKQGAKNRSSLSELHGKLRKNFRDPARVLMHSRHTGPMEPKRPERAVWIFLAVFLSAAWVALVWLAVMVTETVVAMLEYVVDLAQLY
jgi:hypothetical protein